VSRDQPSLLDRARQAGFTPGARDIEPLIDAVSGGEEADARAAERALVRRADVAMGAALARLAGSGEDRAGARARLARLVGRLAPHGPEEERAAAADRLAALLCDPSAQVRRQAALAIGRLGEDAPVEALARAFPAESDASARRAVAEALGKVGGASAVAVLGAASPGGDPELARVLERARLTAARTAGREEPSHIDGDAAPAAPLSIVFRCRTGLERLLGEELRATGWPAGEAAPGRVGSELGGPLAAIHRVRLHTGVAFPLAPVPARGRDEVAAAVVERLTSDEARAVLSTFTRGAVRYRIAWAAGGHRRAEVWRIAREAARRRPGLVNDPTRSTWQCRVDDGGGQVRVELEPRRLDDPRFAYRVADVPAASHPTLAAALARLAVGHSLAPAEDVVWDPFCGSGLELVERGLLAPARRLLGSDTDAPSLDAARRNLDAAGVAAELTRADALAHAPAGVTCIVSNPPMGRRVLRGQVEPLLLGFVERAGALLRPGGVFCWISPVPGRTRSAGARAGLRLEAADAIDMGGFAAEIQVFRRQPAR